MKVLLLSHIYSVFCSLGIVNSSTGAGSSSSAPSSRMVEMSFCTRSSADISSWKCLICLMPWLEVLQSLCHWAICQVPAIQQHHTWLLQCWLSRFLKDVNALWLHLPADTILSGSHNVYPCILNIGGSIHDSVKTSTSHNVLYMASDITLKGLFQVQPLIWGDDFVVCLQDVVLGSTNITFVFSIRWCNMWQMAWGTVKQCLVCTGLPSAVVLKFWVKSPFWTNYWTLFLSSTPDDSVFSTQVDCYCCSFQGPGLVIFVCVSWSKEQSVKGNFCLFKFAWMGCWLYLQIMDGSKVCEGIAPLDVCKATMLDTNL